MALDRRALMRALRRTHQEWELWEVDDDARDELLQRWLWRADTGITYLTADEIEQTFDREWPA